MRSYCLLSSSKLRAQVFRFCYSYSLAINSSLLYNSSSIKIGLVLGDLSVKALKLSLKL